MARKKTNTQAPSDTNETLEEAVRPEEPDTANQQPDPDTNYELIIERGEADKLSPKSVGKIYFQFAKNLEDSGLYLRITGNDGGGLHSREWVDFQKVIDTISPQSNHPFKSTLLKSCMKGKSSNNTSFLAAILRSPEIRLIKASDKSAFLHLLVDDFDNGAAALLQRAPE